MYFISKKLEVGLLRLVLGWVLGSGRMNTLAILSYISSKTRGWVAAFGPLMVLVRGE